MSMWGAWSAVASVGDEQRLATHTAGETVNGWKRQHRGHGRGIRATEPRRQSICELAGNDQKRSASGNLAPGQPWKREKPSITQEGRKGQSHLSCAAGKEEKRTW